MDKLKSVSSLLAGVALAALLSGCINSQPALSPDPPTSREHAKPPGQAPKAESSAAVS